MSRHTDLYTKESKKLLSAFKTSIYDYKLEISVDNLCKCVEKIEDKSVLRGLLLEGL
jgi:hypothetical protein